MPLSRMENTTFAMPSIIDSHDMGWRTVYSPDAQKKTPIQHSEEDISLSESDCEESEEKRDIIDYILINPDIYITRDGPEWISHNSNVPGRFVTRNVL
ncbi:uncharacterized protein TNCV_1349071 [Trichonephila clavipes]|nr:uncharacterized protein TNCV_1349071 [Trichonephila clavipes]